MFLTGKNENIHTIQVFPKNKLTKHQISFCHCWKRMTEILGRYKYCRPKQTVLRKDNGSLSTAEFKRYPLNNKTIQHICQGDKNVLWLGSGGGSLIRFNSITGETKDYPWKQDGTGPSHPYVFYVFKDSYENMWLGTAAGGLNLFDEKSRRFIYIKNETDNKNSLSNNMVLVVFEDNEQQLWVGTAGGLNRLTVKLKPGLFDHFQQNINTEKDSLFVRYGIPDGLPNDVIYGMLQDDQNNIWISTNKGLVKFNVSKNSYKHFDVKDGIQNNEFSQNAFYKNAAGEFYFGGADGFNIFHPGNIKVNNHIPRIALTDFRLYNETVTVNEKGRYNFLLSKSISYADEIKLAYHHKVISFEFAALSYINPEKNQYQYKLEGFNKEWVNAGDIRLATYTNLDAGNYVFRVRAANNDGVWNEEGTTIRLSVAAPPWLRWYAWLAYLLAFSFAVYYFIQQRINAAKRKIETGIKIEKAKNEAREVFRKQTSQDFHDEAGNKITKINLFTALARAGAEDNPDLKNYLDKIYQNTSAISAGMRDFIWALNPEKDTLSETILRLKEFGNSMFTDAGVAFTLTGLTAGLHDIKLPMDIRRAILQVFKEAMNNAAKYAAAKHIELVVSIENRKLEIQLKDDGRGFDAAEEKNNSGYGMQIMKDRARIAGAQFTVHSQKEKGTQVTLLFNLPHMRD